MRDGKFEQIGSPQDIYQAPRTRFVADFMGASNIFSGQIVAGDAGTIQIETDNGLEVLSRAGPGLTAGAAVDFSLRPEDIQVYPGGSEWSADNKFDATIVEKLYLGDVTELELTLSDENRVTSRVQSRDDQKFGFKEGDAVSIGWNAEDCNLLSD
jgi:ABC-type Fe3+/spermidine/putrescine transport system ATPase subunit